MAYQTVSKQNSQSVSYTLNCYQKRQQKGKTEQETKFFYSQFIGQLTQNFKTDREVKWDMKITLVIFFFKLKLNGGFGCMNLSCVKRKSNESI